MAESRFSPTLTFPTYIHRERTNSYGLKISLEGFALLVLPLSVAKGQGFIQVLRFQHNQCHIIILWCVIRPLIAQFNESLQDSRGALPRFAGCFNLGKEPYSA